MLCCTSGVAIGSALTVCIPAGVHADRPKQMNIVYIMCDDHSFQTISAYRHPLSRLAPTPNIDRLARMGIRFDRAYVENSLSTPSRACLMTGLYSHQNGQTMLDNAIDTTITFIPELLQASGYQTAMIGKWHMRCEPRGFDDYRVLSNQGEYYNPRFKTPDTQGRYLRQKGYATELIADYAIDFMEKRDKNRPFLLYVHHKAPHRPWLPPMKYLDLYEDVDFPLPETFYDDYDSRGAAARDQRMRIDSDMSMIYDLKVYGYDSTLYDCDRFKNWKGSLSNFTQDERREWIAAYDRKNEAFLRARESMTHDEFVRWKFQRYIKDYVRVIKSVDDSVGRLLDYLESNHLMDNTLIVYTSDQGFYMGEHGWFDKRFMYEESMRTPLVIRYPREIRAGSVSSEMVQNIDYAPTFLEYAGVKQPKEMTGRSLRKLFKHTANNSKKIHWRKSLYYHYYDYPAWHLTRKHDGVRTDRYKLIHFYGKGGARALTENRYQQQEGTREYNSYRWMAQSGYITDDPDIDYYELYDLQEDPNELNNIYGKPGTERITKRLKRLLKRYRKELAVKE